MNHFNIECRGFEITKDFQNYLLHQINHLLLRCPEKSFLNLTLIKSKDSVNGTLTINSVAFSDFTTCDGESIAHVVTQLVEAIERKLRKWKFVRFMPQASSF